MSIIKKISDCIHYYFDSLNVTRLKIKIDHFLHNKPHSDVLVVYRIGRQKLLNKMSLSQFEQEYFEKVSNYDQHRLTKFSTLQNVLGKLFTENVCDKEIFSRFIEEQIKSEQLF